MRAREYLQGILLMIVMPSEDLLCILSVFSCTKQCTSKYEKVSAINND